MKYYKANSQSDTTKLNQQIAENLNRERKMKLLLMLVFGASLFTVSTASADIRSVKRDLRDALSYCESDNSRREVRCLKREVESLKDSEYSEASSRNMNRLICLIDTEYYDDDGDGWGWIPATRESCVVIGQRDTSRRAHQLDNAMDIYRSIKWLKGVQTCFDSSFSNEWHSSRSHRDLLRDPRRPRRDDRVNRRARDRAAERQIECIEDQVERRRRRRH